MTKQHQVTITAGVKAYVGVGAKGFRAGARRFFTHVKAYLARQRNRGGATVQVDQVVDRENDRYRKKVVVIAAGEVLRDVDEPLSQHRK